MPTRDTTGLTNNQVAVLLAACLGFVLLAGYGIMVCKRREQQKNALFRGEASGDVLEVTIGDDAGSAGPYMTRNPAFAEQTLDEQTPDYGRLVRQITADVDQFPGEAAGDPPLEVTIAHMTDNPTFSEQTPDEHTPDYGRLVRQITADVELQFPGEL
jgi:hypothetical protein